MAKFISNKPLAALDTDAGVRAWANDCHNFLVSTGLLHIPHANELDLNTVTAQTTNLSSKEYGWRNYELNDSLSSQFPVYIKVWFGAFGVYATWNVGSPHCVSLAFIVGNAIAADGSLTGGVTNAGSKFYTRFAANVVPTSAANNTVYMNSPYTRAAKKDGYFFCTMHSNSTMPGTSYTYMGTYSGFLMVARSKNADGTPNGNGVHVGIAATQPRNSSQNDSLGTCFLTRGGENPTMYYGMGTKFGGVSAMGLPGGQLVVYPVMSVVGGALVPFPGLVNVATAQSSDFQEIGISHDGVTLSNYLTAAMPAPNGQARVQYGTIHPIDSSSAGTPGQVPSDIYRLAFLYE